MQNRFVLLAVLLYSAFAFGQKVRVACVGNSITYGAGIAAREQNSYPAQLQYYLGEDYEVRNFGVSGCTSLQQGDYPYVQTGAYAQSLEFRPDIILIKLGTNDSKPQNWQYTEKFESDYQTLIDAYRKLPGHPRVILLSPVHCFLAEGSEINARIIAQEIHPIVENLAYRNGLEMLDLSRIFGADWNWHLMPDRLHPSSIGAGLMAQTIGDYLLRTAADNYTIPSQLTPASSTRFNFHGYEGYDFFVNGVACKLVKPRVEATGRPWVLRARFWDHEPQTDIALLEQGFHIAYCDVADLYGAPQAAKRWDTFYRYMKKAGFSPKVVLEGMSRGGLIVYNWAAANPRKVACIYADAPVMDYRSWPMGIATEALPQGERSDDDVRRLLTAYGFADETAALKAAQAAGGPAGYARTLARKGVPILHVVGDADEVVPVNGNTALFEARMKQLGTPIQVIHKPACGHHPHSLFNPAPIVRFVLKNTGHHRNVCTHPVPGNEFRWKDAGWQADNDWHSMAANIRASLADRHPHLLLLGSSITQGWGGIRSAVVSKPGKTAMDEVCGEGNWESAGISGDRTQNLLWRILNDDYELCKPDNVIIAIGVNNLLGGDEPADVAEGIVAVTHAAEQRFTNAKIILLGLFPAGREKNNALRVKYDAVQTLLATQRFERAVHINPTNWFVDEAGTIRDGLYTGDYIHFTTEGYRVAASRIAPLLR